jgi:hypothetical protein
MVIGPPPSCAPASSGRRSLVTWTGTATAIHRANAAHTCSEVSLAYRCAARLGSSSDLIAAILANALLYGAFGALLGLVASAIHRRA